MTGHIKSSSEFDESTTSKRFYNSQRFERLPANPIARGGSLYTADELIARLMNQSSTQLERLGSHRVSSVSDTIARELALAESSFNPSDLLREGLDEWHDRSISMQLLKRTQSVSASRRRSSFLRNPSRTSSRFTDVFPSGVFPSEAWRRDAPPEPEPSPGGPRHRYNFDYGAFALQGPEGLDLTVLELPKEYTATLTAAPQATLIHLVMLYHQTLIKHGFKDDAQKIADHLSELEYLDMEEMAAELSGIDLLLRDGLLKYLMAIQPYIPPIPSQIVKFKGLGFTGTVQLDAGYESIYTKALETIKGPLKKSPLEQVTLLRDITGYFMPGTLTLIMGTPGSGISVINTVLAGRANRPGATTEGTITYNNRNVNDIKSRRLVAFIAANDVHYATLTVRETLEFARECSQYYRTKDFGQELRSLVGDVLNAGQDPKLETNLSMMGLKRVAEKLVGNPLIPGITEAERHRLTVAEMVAGTYAVYLFDQLNKGLDNTVSFDLLTSIRIFTRVRKTTVVTSLIQPSQEMFDLFDRIILLDRGHIVYQGPRQDALPYFESLGYVKPRQLSVPEFLEEVTTSDGAQFLQQGFQRLNVDDFVAAYKKSNSYKDVCRIVDTPEVVEDIWVQGAQPFGVNFVQRPNKSQVTPQPPTTVVTSLNEKGGSLVEVSMNHTGLVRPGDEVAAIAGPTGVMNYVRIGDPKEGVSLLEQSTDTIRLQLERLLPDEGKGQEAQFTSDYVQDAWPEFKLLLKRDLTATWRNKLGLYIRAFQVLVLGFYIGFTFFRVEMDFVQLNLNLLRSVFFVSLLDMTLFNVGQLPALIEERSIYYKQNGAQFFRPSSYLFAKVVGSLPFALAEATTWTMITYFLSNLSIKDGGWHFWVFYILIVLSVLNGAAMVRFMSAFAPTQVAANGMVGMMVAIFIVFAGFLIPRHGVPNYWIWAYYLDPLQWGITALMINEFSSQTYSTLCKDIPRGNYDLLPACRDRDNHTVGYAYLQAGQFYTQTYWIAISVTVLIAWFIVWTLLTLRALSNIRHVPVTIITPSAEARFLRKTETMVRDIERQGGGALKLSVTAVPLTLSWHELSYDVTIPGVGRTLNLLNYVSGWADPGEMVGLLGASGSGKTTLLNCLVGRNVNFGRMGGQILVNGYPKIQDAFLRVVGYVDQLEAYSPYMTVREAIAFNCELQLSKTTTVENRKEFVEEIVKMMELQGIEHTLVKSLGQSFLTLRESTRLRIATELARNPSILFLDMPTKDLDSRSSLHLVKTLKNIADTGRIVIAAMPLHSQRLLTCFSSVHILKRGGETVYWGPVGADGELIKAYFESIPGTPPCPPNTSVTAYAVDVIGDGVVDRKAMKDYAFEYRVNELALHNHIQLQRLRRSKGTLGSEISDKSFGASYSTRAREIFRKLQLYYWRNVAYSWGRMFSSVATSLLLGSIYFHQKTDTIAGLNTKSGAIFISALLLAITNAQAVIPQVLINRVDFAREKSSRQFNLFLYMTSWTFGEVPYLMVSTLIYAGIFCGMVQMATSSAADFFNYWFILFELTLGITFFGMFLASASVIPQIAGTAVTICIGFWVATSGVVIPKDKILPQFLWIFWTNPLQYALNSLTSIAFYCDVDKPECTDSGRNPNCLSSARFCPQCDCPRLTDAPRFKWVQIASARSLNHARIPYDMLTLFLYIVFFRLLTFAVWRLRDGYKRKAS